MVDWLAGCRNEFCTHCASFAVLDIHAVSRNGPMDQINVARASRSNVISGGLRVV